MQYFDYETVARESGISETDLEVIKEAMRAEYPADDMMWELHILRACSAVRDGHVTIDDITNRAA